MADSELYPHPEYQFYAAGQDIDLTTVNSTRPYARAIKMLGPGTISVEWLSGNVMTATLDQGELDAGGGDFVGYAKRILAATTVRLRVGW